MTSPNSRRAHVIGLGLIGSSVALALGEAGWNVSGHDENEAITAEALRRGIVSADVLAPQTDLVVIATPAGAVVDVVRVVGERLEKPDAIITDVAGVKQTIVEGIDDDRFLAGHPMAGSELRGFAGARANLFEGCTWVLSPTHATRVDSYSRLHGILRELGANVVAVSAADHDRLVAIASHVPHLLAGALMNEAARAAEEDAVLLQLAAGGFRDMTRVAAGDPAMWPDVLIENREAITSTLMELEQRLRDLRATLEEGDRQRLTQALTTASVARRQLPGRALDSEKMTYLRIGVNDQPGSLATVTMTASDMLVNIYDIEIAHNIDGSSGTLLLAVDAAQAELFADALRHRGFLVGHS